MRGAEIVTAVREKVGDLPCLFHHHTTEPILHLFPADETVVATVLRDPVDRFVSEVFHSRAFLCSYQDEEFVAYHAKRWGVRYVKALTQPDISTKELLDVAASVEFLRNYYTKYFAALFDFHPSRSRLAFLSSGRYLQQLASLVRSRFSVIGNFDDLHASYSEIAEAFGIGSGEQRLELAINGPKANGTKPVFDRRRYQRLFRSDYDLIQRIRELPGDRSNPASATVRLVAA